MTTQIKRIQRLKERAEKEGSAGRFMAEEVQQELDRIERALADFVRDRTGARFETQDCPDSDPNCDEPGDPAGGG